MTTDNKETIHHIYSQPKRNLFTLLPKMINLIPVEQDNDFKLELEKQLENAAFTAPENIYYIWVNVQSIITNRFKNYEDHSTLPSWSKLLLDIWTDKKNQVTNSDTS
jgi:hypothetical protein